MEFVVLCTTPNREESQRLATLLVEQKLAACVNIVDSAQSLFFWEGKTENETESLLIIKTSESAYETLESTLIKAHPYDVPEIIALPIARGSKAYLQWIRENTKG